MKITKEQVVEWLEDVKDPEIPVLSLVDLGVITNVEVGDTGVKIELTPTFVGCPALDMIKDDIVAVLKSRGIDQVDVEVTFRETWTSDKISEKGKAALRKFGLSPPPPRQVFTDLEVLENAACP